MKQKDMMKYVLIIFLSTFSISCLKKNVPDKDYQFIVYDDLSKNFNDTLLYLTKKKIITKIEILISGEIRGKGFLEIDNGVGRFSKICLKGNLNEKYQTEWYQNKFIIKYTSQEFVVGDSLMLQYRIW